MKHLLLIGAALALVPVLPLPPAAASAAERPNILFIMTDQQQANDLGAAGNPYVKTPAMDSLAARGVRFEKSYCTYPLCTPARASLDTSRMPHELNIFDNGKGIPKEVPTMGEIFRKAGYETAWAGKWHVPTPYPGFNNDRQQGGPRGFEVLPLEGPKHRSNPNVGPGMGSDPATVKAALKFLRQPHDKPFLLTVSLLNPHDICEYPKEPEHFPRPAADTILPPLPANFDATTNEPPPIQAWRTAHFRPGLKFGHYGSAEWQTYRWVYYRLTEVVDNHIATVPDALRESGLAENTLVVFTSDHGEMCGSHQLATKSQMYEEAVNVPLIVCVPSKAARPAVDKSHLVSGLDILPTLCDYAGIPPLASFEGRSLRPLLEGAAPAWRQHLIVELGKRSDTRMVRSDRYKYVVYASGATPEMLFDLQNDPEETRNLATAPGSQPVLEEHSKILKEWIARTGDRFVFPAEIGSL